MLCTDVGDQAMSAAAGRTAIASFPRCACRRRLTLRSTALEADSRPAYICQMPETFKCPHCGALYQVTYEKLVSPNKAAANCQVCGKQMDSTNGSSIPCYELVKMPDGTNV
jgi:hypothetical protein